MKRGLAIVLAVAVCAPATAGSFGIDFSPLSAPGFGKRRDYVIDTTVDSGGGNASRPARPPRPSPEMRGLGRDLDYAEARLANEIITIDELRMPGGDIAIESLDQDLNDGMFNAREDDWTTFTRLPDVQRIAYADANGMNANPRALAMAAVLLYTADKEGGCGQPGEVIDMADSCENSAFLADQAATVLMGGPVRVRFYDDEPEVTNAERSAAVRAMAESSSAMLALASARTERLAAERALIARKPEVWEQTPESERYNTAIRAERLAAERLHVAQNAAREAVKAVRGD